MAGYTTMWIDKNLISLVAIPLSEEFNLTKTQLGMLMSAYSLGYALVSLPGGMLSDRFGYKKVILGCMIISAIVCAVFPFASVLILFILIRFLLGVGHGSIPSSSAKAIALNYDKDKRVMVQSVWFMGGSVGGLISAYVGSRIIAVDWHYAYYSVALCYAISAVLIVLFLKNIQSAEQNHQIQQKKKSEVKNSGALSLLKNKNVLVLSIGVFAFNMVLNGSIWFPTFLKGKFDVDLVTIGSIQTTIFFLTIATPPLCGYLSSKFFNNRESLFIFLSAIVSACCYASFAITHSLALVVIAFGISSFTSMFTFITIKNLPHKIIPEANIGTTMGLITAISSLGGFTAPIVLGYIVDKSGSSFDYAYYALAALILIGGFICMLFINSKTNNEEMI
ncbi:MFS transporter (plasmid) [Klebsiella sp. B345]|uniref:MFS transporter n=1 Tax=Klebsiella sp. B345 TaxID=2755398 RepID=UPI003DAA1EF7